MRRQRPLKNVPSQQPSGRVPYFPGAQADIAIASPLQRPHEHGYGGQAPGYVMTTYDARPFNAVDFVTQTGTHPDDTGQTDEGPFVTSSTFYTVPPGRVAILRNWHALIVPENGENYDGGNPVFRTSGASNFLVSISLLVDGVFQLGMSGIRTWAAAFGDVFSDCYVVAAEGQTIECRLSSVTGQSAWAQGLVSLYGQLLLAQGMQPEFEPGTYATIPVHDQRATAEIVAAGKRKG